MCWVTSCKLTRPAKADKISLSGVGKTVRIRHYPVTVSAESLPFCLSHWDEIPGKAGQARRSASQETCQIEIGLHSAPLGELRSVSTRVLALEVAAAYPWFPFYLGVFFARMRGQAVQHLQNKSVTLVLGGVRSGKSRYAQDLATRSRRVAFVATAERRDDEEMRAKIERHRADRPAGWTTLEEPLNLAGAVLSAGQNHDVVLIDCITLFAANLLEGCGEDSARLIGYIDALCEALQSPPCSVVLVSNEVGSGVVPAYELGRRYRDLVGEINQRVAAVADTVVLMIAGLPQVLKGTPTAGGSQ